jgi:hypothetical protein
MRALVCARKDCDRPDCKGVGEDEGVHKFYNDERSRQALRRAVPCFPSRPPASTRSGGQAQASTGAIERWRLDGCGRLAQSPNLQISTLRTSRRRLTCHSSSDSSQMNIPPTKACCLSSSLHRRQSSTLPICPVFTLHRSRRQGSKTHGKTSFAAH